MKDTQGINTTIAETTQKLDSVHQEVADLKQRISTLKTSNLHLVENQVGKERKSKSLQIQRKKLFNLQAQRRELKDVRDYLEDRLAELQQNRKFAAHYQQVQLFHDHDALFSERNQEIHEAIQTVADSLAELNRKVQELKEGGHPLVRLRTILGALEKEGIAFQELFQDGSVDETVGRYRLAATAMPASVLDAAQKIQDDYQNFIGYGLYPMK